MKGFVGLNIIWIHVFLNVFFMKYVFYIFQYQILYFQLKHFFLQFQILFLEVQIFFSNQQNYWPGCGSLNITNICRYFRKIETLHSIPPKTHAQDVRCSLELLF